MGILDLDTEFREIRAKIHYASLDNDIPIEQKAKTLGLTVGRFLEFCWTNDLMPHPGESPAMKISIRAATQETLDGTTAKEAAEKIGICESTVKMLLSYRRERKVRFFKGPEQLQTIYELFVAGWSDEDIAEAVQVEMSYIGILTDIFFKRKQTTIGFQAR